MSASMIVSSNGTSVLLAPRMYAWANFLNSLSCSGVSLFLLMDSVLVADSVLAFGIHCKYWWRHVAHFDYVGCHLLANILKVGCEEFAVAPQYILSKDGIESEAAPCRTITSSGGPDDKDYPLLANIFQGWLQEICYGVSIHPVEIECGTVLPEQSSVRLSFAGRPLNLTTTMVEQGLVNHISFESPKGRIASSSF